MSIFDRTDSCQPLPTFKKYHGYWDKHFSKWTLRLKKILMLTYENLHLVIWVLPSWWGICLQCRGPGFDPSVGKTPGEGIGNPLQCSCLGNPMERGASGATATGLQEVDVTQRLNHHQPSKNKVQVSIYFSFPLHSSKHWKLLQK